MCFEGIIWVGGGDGESLIMCCFWTFVPPLTLIFFTWTEGGLGEEYVGLFLSSLDASCRCRKLPPLITSALPILWRPMPVSSSTGELLPGLTSSLLAFTLNLNVWWVGGLWSGDGLGELLTLIRDAFRTVTFPCCVIPGGDGLPRVALPPGPITCCCLSYIVGVFLTLITAQLLNTGGCFPLWSDWLGGEGDYLALIRMSFWAFALFDDRSGGEGSGLPALLERPDPTNWMCFNGIFFAFESSFPSGLAPPLSAGVISGEPLACRFRVKNCWIENAECCSVLDCVIAILTWSDTGSGACLGERFVWC